MAPLATRYHRHCWGDDLPARGRAAYRAHNDLVRRLADEQGRRFLEYTPGDGWTALCAFLGEAVPMEPFPRSDDWAGYKKAVEAERKKEEEQDQDQEEASTANANA